MPRLDWSCSCSSKAEAEHPSGANWFAKAEEMMSIITTVLRSACGSLHYGRVTNLLRRGLVLFTVGVFLALVLNLLQIQRHVTLFPDEVMATLFSSAWWIPPCCGTGAGESGPHNQLLEGILFCLQFSFFVNFTQKCTKCTSQRVFIFIQQY